MSSAWAQDSLSLHFNARPIGEVVAELATKSGKPLKTSPTMGNTVAVVHLENVSAAVAKERIAQAFAARWVKEGDTEYLQPNDMERRRLGGIAFAKKVEEVKKSLAKLGPGMMGGMAGVGGTFAVGMRTTNGQEKPPRTADTVLAEMAQRLPVNTIAALEDGQRAVFATSPNRVQYGLPLDVQTLLREYIALHNEEAKRQANNPPPKIDFGGDQQVPSVFTEMMEEQFKARQRKSLANAAKIILVAAADGGMPFMGGSLKVTLKAFDAEGKILAVSSVEGTPSFMDSVEVPDAPNPDNPETTERRTMTIGGPKKEPKDSKPIEFSKLAQEFNSAGQFNMEAPQAMMADVSPELAKQLMRPDLYDPLSYREGEALAQIAKTRKANLVAMIADPSGSTFSFLQGDSNTEEGILKEMEDDYSVTNKDGFMIVTPLDPARAKVLDRGALTRLIAVAQTKWIPSLDDLADFARGGGDLSTTPITQKYAKVAPFLGATMMPGSTNWDALTFYGNLDPGKRQQLRQGGISFGMAGQGARTAANVLLMGEVAKYRTSQEWAKENSKNFMVRMMSMFSPNQAWISEPTEVNPNGIPENTAIQMVGTPESVVVPARNGKPDLRYGALDADMYGLSEGMAEQFKDQPEVNQWMPDMSTVFVGTQTRYRLTFEVRPGIFAQYDLVDTQFDTKAKPMHQTNLPTDFRKMANASKEQSKNMFPAGMFMGGGPMARP